MISSETPSSTVAPCPECRAAVAPAQAPMVCEIVACDGCGAELEVVGCDPLVLALAPEVEEDWGE